MPVRLCQSGRRSKPTPNHPPLHLSTNNAPLDHPGGWRSVRSLQHHTQQNLNTKSPSTEHPQEVPHPQSTDPPPRNQHCTWGEPPGTHAHPKGTLSIPLCIHSIPVAERLDSPVLGDTWDPELQHRQDQWGGTGA